LRYWLAGFEKSLSLAKINRLSKSQYPKKPTRTPRASKTSVPSKLEGGLSRMSFVKYKVYSFKGEGISSKQTKFIKVREKIILFIGTYFGF
jgi:hypothetical protein